MTEEAGEEFFDNSAKILKDIQYPSQFEPTKKVGPRYSTRDFINRNDGKVTFRRDHHDRSDRHREKGSTAVEKGIFEKQKDDEKNLLQEITEGVWDYIEDKDTLLYERWDDWEVDDLSDDIESEGEKVYTQLPEAVQDISTLRKTDRNLAGYKAKLLVAEIGRKYEAVGATIQQLYRIIQNDPDVSFERLLREAIRYNEKINLSPTEEGQFSYALERYTNKHNIVESYAALYPDQIDLFTGCFEFKPKGKIQVVKGPMTLQFICSDDHDFAAAYNWHNIHGDRNLLNSSYMNRALSCAGAALPRVKFLDLDYTVTIARAKYSNYSLRVHEDQHHFNKLFTPIEQEICDEDILLRSINHAVDPENIKFDKDMFMNKYLRLWRKKLGIDERARDEILAQYRGGSTVDKLPAILDNHYDYSTELSEKEIDALFNTTKKMLDKKKADFANDPGKAAIASCIPPGSSVSRSVFERDIDIIFGPCVWLDYRDALDAIKKIDEMGYSRNEVLGILYPHPLHKWSTIARRLGVIDDKEHAEQTVQI